MRNRRKFAVLQFEPRPAAVAGAILVALGGGAIPAQAHGFVGDRFFPPTIATDDPFATDELLLPAISHFKSPGDAGVPPVTTTDVAFEFDKEIFPKFALGINGDWLNQRSDGAPTVHGFDNLNLTAKYQVWQNAQHEAILSIGAEWEIGGSGNERVGADSASTFTPTIYFGKGFGDLPDAMKYARPFALTGTVGAALPVSADPDRVEWGIAVEYSLPYLQAQVKDVGLPAPLKKMIPVAEFAFDTPVNRGGGRTTGTINPGVLYDNAYFQIGAEAIIPINGASGHGVGAVIQIQIFLDDIFPKAFGHPLFGK
jgi:hypothetical protein